MKSFDEFFGDVMNFAIEKGQVFCQAFGDVIGEMCVICGSEADFSAQAVVTSCPA